MGSTAVLNVRVFKFTRHHVLLTFSIALAKIFVIIHHLMLLNIHRTIVTIAVFVFSLKKKRKDCHIISNKDDLYFVCQWMVIYLTVVEYRSL